MLFIYVYKRFSTALDKKSSPILMAKGYPLQYTKCFTISGPFTLQMVVLSFFC